MLTRLHSPQRLSSLCDMLVLSGVPSGMTKACSPHVQLLQRQGVAVNMHVINLLLTCK